MYTIKIDLYRHVYMQLLRYLKHEHVAGIMPHINVLSSYETQFHFRMSLADRYTSGNGHLIMCNSKQTDHLVSTGKTIIYVVIYDLDKDCGGNFENVYELKLRSTASLINSIPDAPSIGISLQCRSHCLRRSHVTTTRDKQQVYCPKYNWSHTGISMITNHETKTRPMSNLGLSI